MNVSKEVEIKTDFLVILDVVNNTYRLPVLIFLGLMSAILKLANQSSQGEAK